MKFTQLRSKANVIASCLLGGNREYHRVIIQGEGTEQLTLPVTPWKYQITTAQNNNVVDILDFGEALLFGNTKLKRLKFSCFFPHQERHENHKYVVGDKFSPNEWIDRIIKWKGAKKPVRVIITDSPVTTHRPPINDKQVDTLTKIKECPTDKRDPLSGCWKKSIKKPARLLKA